VPSNQLAGFSLEVRAREAIRQSNVLISQTRTMLRTLSERIAFTAGDCHAYVLQRGGDAILNWIVEDALRITNASKANIQVFDSSRQALRIVAQHGFDRPFLDYFDCVREEEAACGAALNARARVIVEDVTTSEVFHPGALEVLLDARVRAVQSTPLIGRSGAVLGILSTHWSAPCRPDGQLLSQLDRLAGTVSGWLEESDFSHSTTEQFRSMLTS